MPKTKTFVPTETYGNGRPEGTMAGEVGRDGGAFWMMCGISGTRQLVTITECGPATNLEAHIDAALRKAGWEFTYFWGWCKRREVTRIRRGIRAGHIQLELV